MIIELSEQFDSKKIADMCGGTANAVCEIKSISIDSRECGEKTLFIALRGENTDGHKYIDSAVKNGAVCVMCERVPEGYDGPYILVDDSVLAIAKAAALYKSEISPFTVGVTGSVGKTTTKEFISYVLAEKYPTHKSGGNFNTIYGLSLTLMAMSVYNKGLVLEMGMSALGEISQLTNVARPDVAVITNIGSAHLEALGSRENICRAKLEIIEGLKEDGLLVYNGDEELLWSKRDTFCENISVGIKNEAVDCFGYNIRTNGGTTVFDIRYKDEYIKDVELPTVGDHNVYNALSAFSVGRRAGLTDNEIRNGLKNYRTTGMRQKIYTNNGYTIIEDCYNAGPESMKASLAVLAKLGQKGRSAAVLGEMRELGEMSDELHKQVGRYAAELGIDRLYTFGEHAIEIAVGALENGMDESSIVGVKDIDKPQELADILKKELKENDVVLFKASRAVKLERVISLLTEQE
ncbi:MAG: UDP-N-acetylmuramoyl-tripeptide--D-alanyl-D-alanine ligase [Clostridia bacterium]|nr:UDP-N-acetylmuramoyl-tripeptide--D-alanyl-D-alanine ligase [Clostridia bacterium]